MFYVDIFLYFRQDCNQFDVEVDGFPIIAELEEDITQFENMWNLYEEFNLDLETLSNQDWISFRYELLKYLAM